MAGTLAGCPSCGAPAAGDATRCGHCGTTLAVVSCPSCFGMMFVGSRFCPGCGAAAQRETLEGPTRACPRCSEPMGRVRVGDTPLQECGRCAGVWVESATLERVCRDGEAQAAVLGAAAELPATGGATDTVRYVPCPECGKLMNRMNFARVSGIVVDVCRPHGTWFDRDELRGIVEFLRSGGMDLARDRERERLEEERRRLERARRDATVATRGTYPTYAGRDLATEMALETAIRGLLRFVGL